jgi:hypothetical protein
MMKYILGLLFIYLITSCSIDSGEISSTDTIKWNFKLDGVQYKWSGNPKDVMSWGSSTYSVKSSTKNSIQLASIQDPMISFDFIVPSLSVGTYTLNSIGSAYITDYSGTIITYYTTNQHQIILKITESNINLGKGKIKGTFSGKLTRENSSGVTVVKNVTEGYFEAVNE